MSLEQIYYLSQLVSTFVLLVSVIYLGRQTHLVAKGQLAQMHQARSEQFQEIMLRMTDPEFSQFVTAAIHGDKNLPNEQIQRFYFYGVTIFRIFEELFRQHREGTIAEDRWNSSSQTLRGLMRAPGYRATYAILRTNLDSEFSKVIDEMVALDPSSEPLDLAALWRNAVPDRQTTSAQVP